MVINYGSNYSIYYIPEIALTVIVITGSIWGKPFAMGITMVLNYNCITITILGITTGITIRWV